MLDEIKTNVWKSYKIATFREHQFYPTEPASSRPPMYLPSKEGEEPSEVNFSNLNDWFFRQGRVPCTWLDSHDYVYGTADKVREALEYIKKNVGFDILCVADSPGASLIGDDLRTQLIMMKFLINFWSLKLRASIRLT